MPFFARKLSADEERALREFSALGMSASQRYQQAFDQLWTAVETLYWPCRESLLNGTTVPNADPLVEMARAAVTKYTDEITSVERSLEASPPERWYPRKFRKSHEALLKALLAALTIAGMVRESLEPPALVPELGKHKLNMFVSGINLLWDSRKRPPHFPGSLRNPPPAAAGAKMAGAPRFAGTLYANGVLFTILGIPFALVGVVLGLAGDFWWVLWVGLAVSALGILLWLIGSTAIAPIFGALFASLGVAVALIGLLVGLTSDFWVLLWIGTGLLLTGVLATFCGFLISASDRR